jgi:Rod binding domain-containing protein
MDNLISPSPDLLGHRAEVKRPSVEDAAREFETMLVAQWLKSARDAGSVLAEQSNMAGSESYMEMAEKTLAETMAQRGTFGLAQMMLKQLTADPSPPFAQSIRNPAAEPRP